MTTHDLVRISVWCCRDFSIEWLFAHTLITAMLGGNVTLPSVILANSHAFLSCMSKFPFGEKSLCGVVQDYIFVTKLTFIKYSRDSLSIEDRSVSTQESTEILLLMYGSLSNF